MATRRGRRLAIRLAACAVAGAAVTVGVAWAANLAGGPTLYHGTERTEPWGIAVPPNWPKVTHVEWADAEAVEYRRWDATEGNKVFGIATRLRVGWPFFAMQWSAFHPARTAANTPDEDALHLIAAYPHPDWVVGHWRQRAKRMPLVPVLPGFALDTAFYASIALTLWSAPGVARRHRRRARGQCPACGYDLRGATRGGGGATCPECGA